MEPETIVIKPTFKCVGNCIGCASRQELYKDIRDENTLGLEDYKRLFQDFKKLGLKKLVISGGEPAFYDDINELVILAKSFGFIVCLNSTGYNLTEDLLDFSKLDAVNFSLNGYNNEIDSKIRGKILFDHTINSIKVARKYDDLCVNVNCIVNKYNYDSTDKLLELVNELGVNALHLSYVEGDWANKNLLLSKQQINVFNSSIKLLLIDKLSSIIMNPALKQTSLNQLKSFLAIPPDEAALGIYNPKAECSRKNNFAIVLPNGDVHPCNIVEYSHEPVVGNVFDSSFTDIWAGHKFTQFRNNPYKYCRYCPVNIRCNLILR